MKNLWFFENVNLFNLLCPHKFKEYKACHTFDYYKKSDYVYFEEDAANKVFLIEKGKIKLGYYTEDGFEVECSNLGAQKQMGRGRAQSFTVNPLNAEELYWGNVLNVYQSSDGGVTAEAKTKDFHDELHWMSFDPTGKLLYIATDGGLNRSADFVAVNILGKFLLPSAVHFAEKTEFIFEDWQSGFCNNACR